MMDPQEQANIVSAIRGALARPTDDLDNPFQPAVLQSAPSTSDMLAIDPPSGDWNEWRKALATKLQNANIPVGVNIRGVGAWRLVSETADAAQPLRGKVAMVTGAAGAIGHGIVTGLLEKGCRVAVTDLPGEHLDGTARELENAFSGRTIPVAMDVTSESSVAAAFQRVVGTWGGLDIVVVNAGIAHVASLIELPLEKFQQLQRVNVDGTLLTISHAAKTMINQGIGGDIILVSTKNVFAPGARFGAYSATKASAHQLARIASLELAEHGIRVNMVSPDAVFSDGARKSGLWAAVGPDRMKARGLDEKGLEEYYRSRNLLKARVTARHVANAVLFFVTHQTPTTGATIPIDGGLPDATPR